MRHHNNIPSSPSLPWPWPWSRAMRWLAFVGTAATIVGATPYPKDDLHDLGFSYLMPRNCASYCGADNQYCCEANQICTTVQGNVATCVTGSYVPAYTTTWTVTYTSTIMTHWIPAPAPTPGLNCVPQAPEQEACGPICCAGWQQCAYTSNGGQCTPRPGYVEPSPVVITSNGQVTTRYSAPFRVTGTTVVVDGGASPTQANSASTASTASPTSTGDGSTIGADGSNKGGTGGGLSPGAIAGIVIGTLAGVALLMLLCFCCIARGVWNSLFGKKKDGETVVVKEERYSRHGSRVPSVHSRRDRHSGWFGGRPASASHRRENKSDGKWWLGLATGATALLTLLNLKKDKKPARKPAKSSRYSDSYYTYSDATFTSTSSSSGGRTHHTSRTVPSYRSRDRDSRGGASHYSRAPSRRP